MKYYKFMLKNGDIVLTSDKIFADFMNEKLTFVQRIKLFFSKGYNING